MAYESPITLATLAFTGEDKGLAFVVYAPAAAGVTRAQHNAAIAADTAPRQDITGWALSWMVKRHKTDLDADALITKTTGDVEITLTDAEEGECSVPLADEDIAVITGERQYWHELKRVDPGFRAVLSFGAYVLNQAVHGDVAS
jgi:hypothetical protein